MKKSQSRREFLSTTSMLGASLAVGLPQAAHAIGESAKPAVLGGPKAHPGSFPSWPVTGAGDEEALRDVLRSGQWFRGNGRVVHRFESEFAELLGVKHCIATSSGTAALTTALGAMDLGPGDEVILPPYTFVATYNVITLSYALPVFVDTNPETFQIDAAKIDAAITPAAKAILPVHIGGSPANLDRLREVAERRRVPVIEDACQAHLAEWRGRPVGGWGLAGCFSFQASKHLTSGEGGAVTTGDDSFAEACLSFHTQGRARRLSGTDWTNSGTRGSNLRLTEFQGSLLLAQMKRLEEQTRRRAENGAYLSRMLQEIPGIQPARLEEGTTRSAFHLFMFRYEKERFAGLGRSQFIHALGAEGVPASSGYGAMNRGEYVQGLARNPGFLRVYGEKRMNEWLDQTRNGCPQNDQLCQEAVWLSQNVLLGTREQMEQIAAAILKIQRHAAEVTRRG